MTEKSLKNALRHCATLKAGVLIHDWDTDGITSAALIEAFFEESDSSTRLTRFTPQIGNYFLTKSDIAFLKKQKPLFVVVVDLALDPADVAQIKALCDTVIIIDHHYQKPHRGVLHINPVAEGAPTNSAPSTSWIINTELWPGTVRPLGVLGMVGDQQEDIRSFKRFFKHVQSVMRTQKLSFEEMLRITQRLHAIYVTNHRLDVMRSVSLLRESEYELKTVLSTKKYAAYQKSIGIEVKRVLRTKPSYEDSEFIVFHCSSKYHLISEITRTLSAQHAKKTVVVTMPNLSDPRFVCMYVRTKRTDRNMQPVIAMARRRGYNAGGKKEVAGMLVPKREVQSFLERVMR